MDCMYIYILATINGIVTGYPIMGKKYTSTSVISDSYYLINCANYSESSATEIENDFENLEIFLQWLNEK